MNIGSLYKVKKWFWFVFPTKETVVAVAPALGVEPRPVAVAADQRHIAAWYRKRFNCEVTYFSPDSIVVFLEEDGELKRVLTADGLVGWTWFNENYNDCFEEVKSE